MRKQRSIPTRGARAVDHPTCPVRDPFDGLAARYPHGPQIPARNFFADVGARSSFVSAIVPLAQVGLDLRYVSVAGDTAGFPRALERAGEHQREPPAREIASDGAGANLTVTG